MFAVSNAIRGARAPAGEVDSFARGRVQQRDAVVLADDCDEAEVHHGAAVAKRTGMKPMSTIMKRSRALRNAPCIGVSVKGRPALNQLRRGATTMVIDVDAAVMMVMVMVMMLMLMMMMRMTMVSDADGAGDDGDGDGDDDDDDDDVD